MGDPKVHQGSHLFFENTSAVDFLVKTKIITQRIIDSIIISDFKLKIDPFAKISRINGSKIKMRSNTIMKFLAHIFFLTTKKPVNIATGNITIFEKNEYQMILSLKFNV